MSQITFSHKFPRRWLAAPEPIKRAIVQELDDIVHLLDHKTELKTFKFSTPDLRQHINTVYADIARQEAEEQEQRQKEAQLQELQAQKEREAKEQEAKRRQEEKEALENERQAQQSADLQQAQDDAKRQVAQQSTTTYIVQPEPPIHIDDTQVELYGESKSLYDTDDDTSILEMDESLVRELESRIDDYLAEQMEMMSENLKAWLRDEIKRNKHQ